MASARTYKNGTVRRLLLRYTAKHTIKLPVTARKLIKRIKEAASVSSASLLEISFILHHSLRYELMYWNRGGSVQVVQFFVAQCVAVKQQKLSWFSRPCVFCEIIRRWVSVKTLPRVSVYVNLCLFLSFHASFVFSSLAQYFACILIFNTFKRPYSKINSFLTSIKRATVILAGCFRRLIPSSQMCTFKL